LGTLANTAFAAEDDFFFVQLSDTHWGFAGPAVNPDSTGILKKAVAAVNSLRDQPDFIMFTGDLTHVTDDDKDRRTRLAGFRDIIKDLKVKNLKFMPGEHDAGLDEGEAFKEFGGEPVISSTTKAFTSSSWITCQIPPQLLVTPN
jgi:3',5'-cyclic AMP phosphodiesterase CpdA